MVVYLYRCAECSNIKAFSIYQIRDFPGGLICSIKSIDKVCIGIMQPINVEDLLDDGGITFSVDEK